MASCPKCKSTRISFQREYIGTESTTKYYRTSNRTRTRRYSSKRKRKTSCLCKDCGYSWYKWEFKDTLDFIIGVIIIVFIVSAIINGCGSQKELTTGSDDSFAEYEITESNIHLVENPSQESIVQVLNSIDGISDIECATEDHDPNSQLNSEHGYTSAVFFRYSEVDQNQFEANTTLDIGTDAGGCIEVYKNLADAQERIDKLSIFKISGSHKLIGTVIVRTSSKMPVKQQAELEAIICQKLLNN